MNILQQEDIVKGLPDQRLHQEAQQPSGQVPQFLVISEIQRRTKMRNDFQAQQQQANPPTVKDQVLQQGIMSAGPQQPPQRMCSGGIVKMASGGVAPSLERLAGWPEKGPGPANLDALMMSQIDAALAAGESPEAIMASLRSPYGAAADYLRSKTGGDQVAVERGIPAGEEPPWVGEFNQVLDKQINDQTWDAIMANVSPAGLPGLGDLWPSEEEIRERYETPVSGPEAVQPGLDTLKGIDWKQAGTAALQGAVDMAWPGMPAPNAAPDVSGILAALTPEETAPAAAPEQVVDQIAQEEAQTTPKAAPSPEIINQGTDDATVQGTGSQSAVDLLMGQVGREVTTPDYADLVEAEKQAGMSNALIQLGAGLAGDRWGLSRGLSAAGDALTQSQASQRQLQVAQRGAESKAEADSIQRDIYALSNAAQVQQTTDALAREALKQGGLDRRQVFDTAKQLVDAAMEGTVELDPKKREAMVWAMYQRLVTQVAQQMGVDIGDIDMAPPGGGQVVNWADM